MRNTDRRVAIIRKGEVDLNKQSGIEYNKNLLVDETVYIPSQILELSWIIRGESGGGKTVFTDRIMKETIDCGHSVILHNVKGDELKKISGYCSFYHIEPWTPYTWELDFLNLCADKNEQAENTKIRTLIEAFSKVPEDFFDKAGIAVAEAVARSVIKSNKDKNGVVKVGLEEIVNTWNSFNVSEDVVKVDMSDIAQVKKAVQQESQQLRMINDFLKKWFSTSSMYIDPKNEKTSLCVLASVVEIMRKFESLSLFWNQNAIDPRTKERRIFNIDEWINKEKDRKVIILSNSNMFGDVANSYISAFINLTTTKLIDSRYEPKKEIHFILDEFAQLSSINLNNFLKLPDVGRGKKVRVKIAIQRTSQIGEAWKNADSKSFISAFQNKIWARFATDDKENLKNELGRQNRSKNKTSANFSAQGESSGSQLDEKLEELLNVDELSKTLGPVKMKVIDEKTGEYKINKDDGTTDIPLGVYVLCNFTNCRAISLLKLPFVNFPKNKEEYKVKSSAGGSFNSNEEKTDKNEDKEKEIKETTKEKLEVLPNQPAIEDIKEKAEENDLGESIVTDVLADSIAESLDSHGLTTILKASEVIEGMENFTQNTNINVSKTEITEDDLEKLINEVSNNKNKEKSR
ncbi:type IV secretion system DNA-binding domain-containing protein [Pseudomonas aeruginosa]